MDNKLNVANKGRGGAQQRILHPWVAPYFERIPLSDALGFVSVGVDHGNFAS